MTVTTVATVKVGTADLRHALKAAHAHHNKHKKDDNVAEHRVRLTFANGTLFVGASNGTSTGLAKVTYVEDTRGTLWEPDDGPMIVDLQPRHVPLVLQQFKSKAAASDVDQLIAIDVNLDDEVIDFTDIGGLWSDGESVRFGLQEPHELFPDIIDITGQALAAVAGESERAKALVQDGRILALFKDAAIQYGAPLQIRATGSAEQRGFVVQCGPSFIGTVSSRHNDDDGLKNRDKWTQEWIRVLRPRSLASA